MSGEGHRKKKNRKKKDFPQRTPTNVFCCNKYEWCVSDLTRDTFICSLFCILFVCVCVFILYIIIMIGDAR